MFRLRIRPAAIFLSFLLMSPAFGQVPRTLSYQGVLTDATGTPKPDGVYDFTIRLYTVASGGGALWSETKSLQIKRGLFSTILGSVTPLPASVKFDQQYWLSVQVASEPELSPRIQLTSVGSSFNALRADLAQTVPDSSLTAGKVASGQVVKSVNTLKDDVTLAAGNNVGITTSGNTLTISSTGGGTSPWATNGNNISNTNPGNVGIGTTNPAVRLDVNGSLRANSGASFTGTNGDGSVITARLSGGDPHVIIDASTVSQSSVLAYRKNNFNRWLLYADGATESGTSDGTNFRLDAYNNAGLGIATRLFVSRRSGFVGIGTDVPGAKLQVEAVTGEAAVHGHSLYSAGVEGYSEVGDGVYAYSAQGASIWCNGKFYQQTGSFEVHPTSTIWSTNKPATVKLNNGAKVKLFTEESTEIYFTDYGEGQLTNGRRHIELDPTFLQTVTIDKTHPLKVFVQLADDCRGVFIANRTSTGFDIVEMQSGTSNASFFYRVVCKRKYYEDERLSTEEEDIRYNTNMLNTVWPEVIAKGKAEREKIEKMTHKGQSN